MSAPVKRVRKQKKKANPSRVARRVPKTVVTGHGAYRKKYVPRSMGAQIGGHLGSMLGHGAQQLIKHITGFGDYKIQANSLMGGLYDPPELHNYSNRSVVIRHREYLTDIVASSAFTLKSYAINPGMNETFPWLSNVASNFEEYRITGMIFEYKTLSADYTGASSAALGFVAMATQYNVYNPPFDNKKVLENYEFSNSAKPSDSFIHPIECKKSLSPVSELFVRTGNVTQGDMRLYDLGNFQIATGGNSGNGILGELWVTFEVEFFKPKLIATMGYDLLTDHWQALTNTALSASPLGTNGILATNSSLGTSINFSTQTISFPANVTDGDYMFNYYQQGSVGAVIVSPTIAVFNCVLKTQWANDSLNRVITPAGLNTTVYFTSFIVSVLGPNATVQFGVAGTLPSGTTTCDLYINQFNSAIDI